VRSRRPGRAGAESEQRVVRSIADSYRFDTHIEPCRVSPLTTIIYRDQQRPARLILHSRGEPKLACPRIDSGGRKEIRITLLPRDEHRESVAKAVPVGILGHASSGVCRRSKPPCRIAPP
jgi:hypothetical protein